MEQAAQTRTRAIQKTSPAVLMPPMGLSGAEPTKVNTEVPAATLCPTRLAIQPRATIRTMRSARPSPRSHFTSTWSHAPPTALRDPPRPWRRPLRSRSFDWPVGSGSGWIALTAWRSSEHRSGCPPIVARCPSELTSGGQERQVCGHCHSAEDEPSCKAPVEAVLRQSHAASCSDRSDPNHGIEGEDDPHDGPAPTLPVVNLHACQTSRAAI